MNVDQAVTHMAELPARESIEFDVIIVGASPADLATAIRLEQAAAEAGTDITAVARKSCSRNGRV
jgi:electron-transferring-flavoprotein dehydrogenase